MKLVLACKCGALWKGSLPKQAADKIREQWNLFHAGVGHGPCGRDTANRARIAAERAAVKGGDA